MLKRLTALLLALFLIATLAACGGSTEPEPAADPSALAFESYSQLMQQLSVGPGQSGAYDMDFTMEIDMTFMGEREIMLSSGNMRMIVDGDNIQSYMVMETDMGELGTMVMELYMAMEGTTVTELRMIVDGMELPSEFLEQEMLEELFEGAVSMPDVEEEAFLSVEVEEVGGNTVMHILLDGQFLLDFALASAGDMFADLGVEMDITLGDVPMSITLDSDDNPLSMTMDMHMTMAFEGEEIVMNMTSEFVFNAFGDSVVIDELV